MAIASVPAPNERLPRSVNDRDQPELRLTGGGDGLPLCFATAPSRRHFVALHGGCLYEILPVPFHALWQARIRVLQGGAQIDIRTFPYEAVHDAKLWLQTRALQFGAGGGR